MSQPEKRRPGRPRRVNLALTPVSAAVLEEAIEHAQPETVAGLQVPQDWTLGQLLNVRNTGPDYCVTLYPEEFDPRRPERALRFTNSAQCQEFVSRWYARTAFDPRA